MISIREIKPENTFFIREKELRKNMNLPAQFTGDLEKNTFHLGLFVDDILVSIVSLMKNKHINLAGEQFQLRGMATLEAYQKNGYGKKLVAKAEQILKNKSVEIIWCNARVVALDFYLKQGYKKIGSEFDIPQIGGHFVMYKNI
ncbi:MAG: GNAT family N-acetyltransferase [Bacteroidota bacterium]